MAGDVGFEERVIVAPAGVDDIGATAAAPVAGGIGRVAHRYGPRVLVVEQGTAAAEALAAPVPGAVVGVSGADVSDAPVAGLDETGRLGLEAFVLRSSSDYAETKAQRPLAGESWDHEQATVPDLHDVEGEVAASALAGAPTSSRLTGSVAVGVVIVEGPTADLQFTDVEKTKVVAEVQNGLSWLGAQSLQGAVTWAYDIRIVTIATEPDPAAPRALEALWRDPAMSQLGFGTGMGAVSSYVQKLRADLATTWAYCAFFTKYPVGHFAYASIGGPRLVMQYANDGWGPDNIDRVFTHETGHIFGAPDEYASSNCTCGGSWGFFQEPNANCAVCASGGGVECLMRANTWAMCQWTPTAPRIPPGRLVAAGGGHLRRPAAELRSLPRCLPHLCRRLLGSDRDHPVERLSTLALHTGRHGPHRPTGQLGPVPRRTRGLGRGLLDGHQDRGGQRHAAVGGDGGGDRCHGGRTSVDAGEHFGWRGGVRHRRAGRAAATGDPDVPAPAVELRQVPRRPRELGQRLLARSTRTAQDNDTQRWVVTADGDPYTIVQLSSGRFLDAHESSANDYAAVTRTAQGDDTQRWTFTPVGAVYEIQQVSSDRYLDAHETSGQDYSVVTRTAQHDDTQRWVVTRIDENEYTVVQLSSRRFLDAYESAPNGYSAVTRTAQGNDTQRWIIT